MTLIKHAVKLMRVHHWIKNAFIAAPLLFAGQLNNSSKVINVLIGCAAFCLISSAVYIMNDIMDRKADSAHPRKSKRPIASGAVPVGQAAVLLIVLAAAGIGIGASLAAAGRTGSFNFLWVLLLYAGTNVAYSLYLKHVVLIDVFILASGFVFRVISGGFAADVPNSEWMLICTVLLSLFLGFSKRRHELVLLGDGSPEHRSILAEYSTALLDRLIGIVTACTVMAYMLYTIDTRTVEKVGSTNLLYTVVFVLYGIFRYLYLVYKKEEGGSPTRIMLTDAPLIINVLLWGLVSGLIISGVWSGV